MTVYAIIAVVLVVAVAAWWWMGERLDADRKPPFQRQMAAVKKAVDEARRNR